MANICIILGESGTGKTTSLRTLNPKETIIINILGKRLPFKGSQKMYSAENKNIFQITNADEIVSLIQAINKRETYKNIVIDDASYLMRTEYFDRAKERGYDKFVDIAVNTQKVIKACQDARADMNVFLLYHAEAVSDMTSIIGYKVATIGKLLDQSYNPIEVVPVVLFSTSFFDDNGNPTYGFYTKRFQDGNIVIPAKSPDGMFEENFIPNDLGLVIKKMNDYYNS